MFREIKDQESETTSSVPLYGTSNLQFSNTNVASISSVDELQERIALMETEVKKLKTKNNREEKQIARLNKKIAELKEDLDFKENSVMKIIKAGETESNNMKSSIEDLNKDRWNSLRFIQNARKLFIGFGTAIITLFIIIVWMASQLLK